MAIWLSIMLCAALPIMLPVVWGIVLCSCGYLFYEDKDIRPLLGLFAFIYAALKLLMTHRCMVELWASGVPCDYSGG